jgi:hypothetical protein
METAISAYLGLLSLQEPWGETACTPTFLKKIE